MLQKVVDFGDFSKADIARHLKCHLQNVYDREKGERKIKEIYIDSLKDFYKDKIKQLETIVQNLGN